MASGFAGVDGLVDAAPGCAGAGEGVSLCAASVGAGVDSLVVGFFRVIICLGY